MRAKKRKAIKLEEGSGNIFADLGLPDADQLLARAQIGFQVFKILEEENLKQREIAGILGVDLQLFGDIGADLPDFRPYAGEGGEIGEGEEVQGVAADAILADDNTLRGGLVGSQAQAGHCFT